ncbi:xanthine dehydrogenase molybdopterin binding subunit [Pseudogulbenkiania sp. MAI-1]|uniref:xanthine dehydrogenase molybdopterin binding subunit n=1 Tax=Pseudogulbenkiania sp. MAI-1 TaxID=990370 RepID=UPI00045EA4E9|nr:xanthine dehydrogenase molybdopterin binding subunit [Pseudogulbenkiania sp. MAI-1]
MSTSPPLHGSVGLPLAHDSAELHVTGRAHYTDDLPELPGTLHAAIGGADIAHGRLTALDLAAVKNAPGVRAVLTAGDLCHGTSCGPIVADDPILCTGEVMFFGQPLFAVAADSIVAARRAVRLARAEYEELPVRLDIAGARAVGDYVLPPVTMRRGDAAAALQQAPHRLQGQMSVGGQEHFYLEGQISYAVPRDDGSLLLYCSTQHPSEMQQLAAQALGLPAHAVSVECRRIGGGFGGKETQSAQWACIAALLAQRTGRPVKLRLDRDVDIAVTGKRHDFAYDYDAGFDDSGRLHGLELTLAARCGCSADLSGPVNDRALFHVDNAYYLEAVALTNLRLRTHTVSNTAFRGFGGPQGMFAIEYVLDDVARELRLDPLAVRRANFYGAAPRDTTHYGMSVEDNVLPALIDELERDSRYPERRTAIAAFNAASPVLKRGLALTPVKFGIAFTATHYNQAGALVHVYLDGSVLVSHGGVEMGQGLHIKVQQVVAEELGLPLERVRIAATDTAKVPNTSASAASSSADLNGQAARHAAGAIRKRLAALFAVLYGCHAATVEFAAGQVFSGEHRLDFTELVAQAYRRRLPLWESGFYRTPKIHYDANTRQGRPFYYFAYGAAVSEVAVDTLSGAVRLMAVDILHDVGRSLNPAIDRGQIEGGFVQGMGWLTSEELYWQPDGPRSGLLATHAPSTYKIPTAYDVPEHFNVKLFDNANHEEGLHHSKAVGEPPLMLALSVFFAIRDALGYCAAPGQRVPLSAPATPQAVLDALDAVGYRPGA